MIKKRYLMVLSVAVVSVLLGSLLYTNLVLADKPVLEPDQVEVTNFPLDEQGNLKVSAGIASEVVTVVEDLKLNWTGGDDYSDRSDSEFLTVDVDGYNEVVIYASFRNWTCQMYYGIEVFFIVDGIEAVPFQEDWVWGETPSTYTSPYTHSALYHVRGTDIKLRVGAFDNRSPYPAGSVLVSVSLYLRS